MKKYIICYTEDNAYNINKKLEIMARNKIEAYDKAMEQLKIIPYAAYVEGYYTKNDYHAFCYTMYGNPY